MRIVLGFAAALVLAGTLAAADVQWWTPQERDCPSFATQADCTAFCVRDPSRCGGNTACILHSGPVAPGC